MIWTAGLAILCLGICMPLFLFHKKALRYILATSFKALGTFCAVVPALVAAIRLDPRCYVCVAALCLHTVADIFMEFSIFWGAGFFMAGHFCYIAFCLQLFPASGVHLICLLALITFMGFNFWRWRKLIGKQMPLFIVYGIVLSVMCACSIAGGVMAHTAQGLMTAAAGALFFISDSLLSYRLLFPTRRWISVLIIFFYYCAQLLFGISCLLI